ncbi:MAG: RNA 2',3'-cyclic phosphodiesterase [Candidatus Binataceae bacterium]
MAESVRAFVAIQLSSEVNEAVAAFQAGLRRLGGEISWTAPANFHLTLRFLGNRVAPEVVTAIIEGLRPIASATPPFTVCARGAGAFPSLNRPRVIWIALRDGHLVEVATQVEALSVKCGLEPENRGFTPHLTIGRVRNPSRNTKLREALEAAADRDFGSSPIASMTLYRSRLSPDGAKYEPLAVLPFARK